MNKAHILILVSALSFSTCDVDVVTPVVEFDLKGVNDDIFITSSRITTVNKTENGTSYLWDFGNGVTSDQQEPTFTYDESGTYTITLLAKSSDKVIRSSSKEIKVLDRVLKQITIYNLNFSELSFDIDNAEKTQIFITIKQYRTKEGNPADILIYKSQVVNLSVNDLPHVIIPNQKIVIDHALVSSGYLSFNIHTIVDDVDYTIGSNLFSGGDVGQSFIQGSPYALATTSIGGAFMLECDYK